MADLAGLIERVGKLDEPDRKVDAAIHRVLARNPTDHWYDFFGVWTTDDKAAPVTASLDAAVALVERCLPGRNRTIRKRYRTTGGRLDGHIFDAHLSGGDVCEGATEPIALILALLRALQSQEADDKPARRALGERE